MPTVLKLEGESKGRNQPRRRIDVGCFFVLPPHFLPIKPRGLLRSLEMIICSVLCYYFITNFLVSSDEIPLATLLSSTLFRILSSIHSFITHYTFHPPFSPPSFLTLPPCEETTFLTIRNLPLFNKATISFAEMIRRNRSPLFLLFHYLARGFLEDEKRREKRGEIEIEEGEEARERRAKGGCLLGE